MTSAFDGAVVWRQVSAARAQFLHTLVLGAIALILVFIPGRMGATAVRGAGSQEVAGFIGQPVAAVPPPATIEARAVAEYVARRYRVSVLAVEPLVQAAGAAGRRAGLDPLLIVAVIAIESGFNPIAESPMGAQGLMQIIPRFHQDKLRDTSDDRALLDPERNIEVGALVLKESIRRSGSLEGGLQQYAGATSDEDGAYAAKVLAEKQRLEVAARAPDRRLKAGGS